MVEHSQKNKLTEIAVNQNLLLWQVSSSLLELNQELMEITYLSLETSNSDKHILIENQKK